MKQIDFLEEPTWQRRLAEKIRDKESKISKYLFLFSEVLFLIENLIFSFEIVSFSY